MFVFKSSSKSSASGFATTVVFVKNWPKLNLQGTFRYFLQLLNGCASDKLQPIHAIQSLFLYLAGSPEREYL